MVVAPALNSTGRKTGVIDVYGMTRPAQFVNTLEDVIRRRGAMDCLISDSANVKTSRRALDILRSLLITDWQSKPYYQHQNPAERRWKFLKRNLAYIMNLRNVDPKCWFLCMVWCADVMNHTAERSLNWRPPLEVLTGRTIDVSILLCFMFWDVVCVERYPQMRVKREDGRTNRPARKTGGALPDELRGRFVGFAWHVGMP